MNLDLLALSFVLTLTRCASFVGFAPQLGDRELPRQVKLGLSVALAIFWYDPFYSMDAELLPRDGSEVLIGAIFVLVFREILLGAALGYLFQMLLLPARIAGSYIGQEMGLNMATVTDPTSPVGTNVIGRLLEVLTIVLFFSLNIHHVLLAGLHGAFRMVPVGAPFATRRWEILLTHFSTAHTQGMLVAAPVAVCLFVVVICLVLLTRASPQLNLFSIGFPLRILAGLLALLVFLPELIQILLAVLGQAQGLVWQLIS